MDNKYKAGCFDRMLASIAKNYFAECARRDYCNDMIAAYADNESINPTLYNNYYSARGAVSAYETMIIDISGCFTWEVEDVAARWLGEKENG